jgi:MinD-like ATPase involved in chromosome partitioning or flagellar assembly
MGGIVTFYSYKGGVGRSMTMANIAVLLAREQLRVLAIDWDLEAPGLERYFHYFSIETSGAGLLPMLADAASGERRSYRDYTWSIQVDSGRPITLLPSGQESDSVRYTRLLDEFDWRRFFREGGGDYVEGLREQWKKDFDIVLIDSRTGLSDTGGVCTIQLPDIVVVMFTANDQSSLGARDVMRHVRMARQALAYPRMELTVFPLPGRFGERSEVQLSQQWIDRLTEVFAEFYVDWLPVWAKPRELLQRVKIPQVDYFGFGERLAVVEQGISDPGGIGFVCDQVMQVLQSDFKDAHRILGLRERVAEPATPAPSKLEAGYEWDLYVSYPTLTSLEPLLEDFLRILEEELDNLRSQASKVFFERREVVLGTHFPDSVTEALRRSRLMLAVLTPAYFQSTWSVAEWRTFEERERVSKVQGLIIPVLVREDSHGGFPDWVTNRQVFRASELFIPGQLKLERTSQSMATIASLAQTISSRLDAVPPSRLEFSIVEPADVQSQMP